MSFSKTIEIDGVEFEVEFSVTPYIAARTSGPVESCYPAEGGEVDIEAICIGEWEVSNVISDRVSEKIKQVCAEAGPEMLEDQRDSDMADAAEARQDDMRHARYPGEY